MSSTSPIDVSHDGPEPGPARASSPTPAPVVSHDSTVGPASVGSLEAEVRPPKIESKADIYCSIEVAKPTDDGTGYDTSFYFLTRDDVVFYGHRPKTRKAITLDEYASALERVPDVAIFPPLPSGTDDANWTVAAQHAGEDGLVDLLHIKRPMLGLYPEAKKNHEEDGSDKDSLAQVMAKEVAIMELLAKQHPPHPNIVRYHGVRVRRGRVTGIVLDKHPRDLAQHVEHGLHLNDVDAFLAKLGSALDYLHTLGLAHNDLNPDNVMVDVDGDPVLIDFGSCCGFGKPMLSNCTYRWGDIRDVWSAEEHDARALAQMREWLKSKYPTSGDSASATTAA